MRYWVAIGAAAALCASSARAQDAVVLQPFSNWVMNYDDDSCALQRQFGKEGQQAFLELREFGGRDRAVQLTIASKDFKRRDGRFEVAILPFDTEPAEQPGFNVRLGDGYEGKLFADRIGANDDRVTAPYRAFVTTTPSLTEEQRRLVLEATDNLDNVRVISRLLRNADYQAGARIANDAYLGSPEFLEILSTMRSEVQAIRIEDGFDRDLHLMVGELRAPMEAMRACLDELYSHWGIDVAAHRSLRRPVIPVNFDEVVQRVSRDYPAQMVRKGLEGYLRIRLAVSAEGQPTACHLQSPLNDEVFNRTACQTLMQRARFSPALDANGQPIASFFLQSIVYTLSAGRR